MINKTKVDGRQKKGLVVITTEEDIGRVAQIRDARGLGGWWEIESINEEGHVFCIVNSLYTDWQDKLIKFYPAQVVQIEDERPESAKEKLKRKRYKLRTQKGEMSLADIEELRREQRKLDIPSEILHPDHPLNYTKLSHIPINPILDIMGMYHGKELASISDIEAITGMKKKAIRYYIYVVPDDHPNKLRPDKRIPVEEPDKDDKVMSKKEIMEGKPVKGKYLPYSKSPVIQKTEGILYFKWKKVWWWYYNRKTPGKNTISGKALVDLESILKSP